MGISIRPLRFFYYIFHIKPHFFKKNFKAMLVHIKKEGKAGVNHKEPISTEDLQKLYVHDKFSLDTPESLLVKREYVYIF
jgi:hypothetical protein